jgi:hypothetical protein
MTDLMGNTKGEEVAIRNSMSSSRQNVFTNHHFFTPSALQITMSSRAKRGISFTILFF